MTGDIDTLGPVDWLVLGRRVVRVDDDAEDAGRVSAGARRGGL